MDRAADALVGAAAEGHRGSLRAYLVFLLSSGVFEGALPVLLAVVVVLPIFILVMLAPWWCLGGLLRPATVTRSFPGHTIRASGPVSHRASPI